MPGRGDVGGVAQAVIVQVSATGDGEVIDGDQFVSRHIRPQEGSRGKADSQVIALEGIEWGGDIHVPPGDLANASSVRQQTLEAGLQIAAYGSYYRLGTGQLPFQSVLETAISLGAPTIRVWAGTVGSRDADSAIWREVVRDGQQIANRASATGLSISLEFHPDTLTDTSQSALRLLKEIDRSNEYSYWQPPPNGTREANAQGLAEILPWLGNVHVFHWLPQYERHPLLEGAADWECYLKPIKSSKRECF